MPGQGGRAAERRGEGLSGMDGIRRDGQDMASNRSGEMILDILLYPVYLVSYPA